MVPTWPWQITLEKTPGYFVAKNAPARIFEMNRRTKIVIVLRDPVSRAISGTKFDEKWAISLLTKYQFTAKIWRFSCFYMKHQSEFTITLKIYCKLIINHLKSETWSVVNLRKRFHLFQAKYCIYFVCVQYFSFCLQQIHYKLISVYMWPIFMCTSHRQIHQTSLISLLLSLSPQFTIRRPPHDILSL